MSRRNLDHNAETQGERWLFLGDSVTDCARKRAARFQGTPAALGHGWVSAVAEGNPKALVFNRGYSGYSSAQLRSELLSDGLLEGMPRLSIATLLIGVNDVWHHHWRGLPWDLAATLKNIQVIVSLLQRVSERVIVGEPFALAQGELPPEGWLELTELQVALSIEVPQWRAEWWPVQSALAAADAVSNQPLLEDGVHPTKAGHLWLANHWCQHELGCR